MFVSEKTLESIPGSVSFTVPGIPVPQGSPKIIRKRNGHASLALDSPKLKAWRAMVTQRAQDAISGELFVSVVSNTHAGKVTRQVLWDEPVIVMATFYFCDIQKPRWGHIVKATRPDLDKLQRAIGDSLEDAGVFIDDSRIVGWPAFPAKRYGEPRAEITILSLANYENSKGF